MNYFPGCFEWIEEVCWGFGFFCCVGGGQWKGVLYMWERWAGCDGNKSWRGGSERGNLLVLPSDLWVDPVVAAEA